MTLHASVKDGLTLGALHTVHLPMSAPPPFPRPGCARNTDTRTRASGSVKDTPGFPAPRSRGQSSFLNFRYSHVYTGVRMQGTSMYTPRIFKKLCQRPRRRTEIQCFRAERRWRPLVRRLCFQKKANGPRPGEHLSVVPPDTNITGKPPRACTPLPSGASLILF